MWKLKKSLYGLKPAPRVWIETLATTLKEAGFQQSEIEPSLFYIQKNKKLLHLLMFVDDLLLTSGSGALINYAKDTLRSKFKMTDLGPVKKYLGWHITRDEFTGKMWRSLEGRNKKVVKEFQQHKHAPTTTPLPTNWQAFYRHEMDKTNPFRMPAPGSPHPYSPPFKPKQHTFYRQGVGFIKYATTPLRPDVSFAAGR